MRRTQWCIQNVLATAGFPEIDEGPVFGKNTPRKQKENTQHKNRELADLMPAEGRA